MRKIKWSNYITQSLICVEVLTIGISTFSVPQNHSSTDEIEPRSITKNPQQLCSNLPAGKPFARTELFFGLRKPNGTEVNNAEFQRFLDREVTPRFPDGFTVISGQGQFKDAHVAISVPIDHQQIEQIGQREGWRVLTRKQGDGIPFSAVEFWVENHFLFEFFSPEFAPQYLKAMQPESIDKILSQPIDLAPVQ